MVIERAGEEQGLKVGGCIKKSHGPWVVHKTTKDGGVVTKYRYPSEKERLNNKERERKRRSITKKIFAGLRAHGNYQLPKHADSNDLLRALCLEAGWYVDHEGNLHKKDPSWMPSLFSSNYVGNDNHEELAADIMKCCSCRLCTHTTIQFKLTHHHGFPLEEHNINLRLSLP